MPTTKRQMLLGAVAGIADTLATQWLDEEDAATLSVTSVDAFWRAVTWPDGSNTPLTSRFARVRVRPAHDDKHRREPGTEECLLIEWPEGDAEPDH